MHDLMPACSTSAVVVTLRSTIAAGDQFGERVIQLAQDHQKIRRGARYEDASPPLEGLVSRRG